MINMTGHNEDHPVPHDFSNHIYANSENDMI